MATVQHRDSSSPLYAACIEAAVNLGASTAPRMLAQVEKSMLERAAASRDPADRRRLADAAQLLSKHKAAIAAAYPDALRHQFCATDAVAPQAKALSFESLELMAEDKVDETVELLRAQQAVQSAVDAELTELNALISTAQGDKVVRASANPLRPPAWVRALRDAASACPVPAGARLEWVQHLSEALGPELAAVYRELSQMLRAQGIAAASFSVHAPAARAAASGAQGAQGGSARSRPRTSGLNPLLNLRDLRRLLVSDQAESGSVPARDGPSSAAPNEPADPGVTVPYSFQALQEMGRIDEAVQRMQERRSRGDGVGAAGGPGGLSPAQALGQEVVKLMVESMAADRRLLPQVQQAVRDLLPALLKLALHDPRFFNDKQHPTRQLLSEMTHRGLGWSSAREPGFATFFEPLRQVVDALAALPVESADPFEFALQSLRQAWNEQEERSRHERAQAAKVLIRAEKRNIAAARIADDLMARQDVGAASPEIRRFLIGPWAQVMAAAQLAAGDGNSAGSAGDYEAIINDLVWTTEPRLASQNANRLAQLIPPLLQTLRHGLASIDYPAAKTQQLMDYLKERHQLALRPDTDFAATAPMSRAELEAGWDSDKDKPEVWLEHAEARDSGLLDLLPDAAPEWKEPLAADEAQPEPMRVTADLSAAGLQPGAWADVFLDGTWSRWQLAWASPQELMFMFTDPSGKHRSMTRPMLDKMMALGALRVLSQQTVLDRALDAVADAALRNSMDSTR